MGELKKRRGLWLLNHEALRHFEVPLLHRLGYEIYTSKMVPKTEEFASESADFGDDALMTIPASVLSVLNQHNFYTDAISPEIAEIVNTYFSFAFCHSVPTLLEQMARYFKGNLFVRAFGREDPFTYGALFSPALKKLFLRMRHRFFFAQLYPFTSEVEDKFYQKRALTLPLSFPPAVMAQENTWRGGNGKLLFVCPRLSLSYYQNIYEAFKRVFADVPHLIAGRQWHPSSDPAVLGSLPRDRYDALFQSSEVMFYHSQEPRHVHYHPLEAVLMGLPLIYMRNGMLSRLVDDRAFPGACNSFEEAKEKVSWILDKKAPAFLQEVLRTQRALLTPFDATHCEREWREKFLPFQEKRKRWWAFHK